MKHETTTSDTYEITSKMLCERLECQPVTLCRYQNLDFIPRGKRRPGVRGIFFTVSQANKLMRRIGSTAQRFEERA